MVMMMCGRRIETLVWIIWTSIWWSCMMYSLIFIIWTAIIRYMMMMLTMVVVMIKWSKITGITQIWLTYCMQCGAICQTMWCWTLNHSFGWCCSCRRWWRCHITIHIIRHIQTCLITCCLVYYFTAWNQLKSKNLRFVE